MELLVRTIEDILRKEPIDIYANPTYLPDMIAGELTENERARRWRVSRRSRLIRSPTFGPQMANAPPISRRGIFNSRLVGLLSRPSSTKPLMARALYQVIWSPHKFPVNVAVVDLFCILSPMA